MSQITPISSDSLLGLELTHKMSKMSQARLLTHLPKKIVMWDMALTHPQRFLIDSLHIEMSQDRLFTTKSRS